MICEICGKEVPKVTTALVEGTLINVCQKCLKFGREIQLPRKPIMDISTEPDIKSYGTVTLKPRPEKNILDEIATSEKNLVDDYHIRIRNARNMCGLNQEQLAQRVGEKKSVIAKLETKSLRPDDKLARKLEKLLNIKLYE